MSFKKNKASYIFSILILGIFFVTAIFYVTKTHFVEERIYASVDLVGLPQRIQNDEFYGRIKPILDNRCVTCHSCFNSPCQLNLSSYEGVERGANKENVYDFGILKDKTPTRLSVDAEGKDIWQSRYFNFYPVINPKKEKSILYHVLINKKPAPQGYEYNAEESRTCSRYNSVEEFLVFMYAAQAGQSDHQLPQWAQMPFGLPPMSSNEYQTITNWVSRGSPGPDPSLASVLRQPLAQSSRLAIAKWENFFNGEQFRIDLNRQTQKSDGDEFKRALTARYIFEHLFLAHIYFDDKNPKEFFRLVRAENSIGEPIEISTRRPNDNPNDPKIFPWRKEEERRTAKMPFYYRFKKITQTLTHKSHLPFYLSDQKLETWEKMFLQTDWKISKDQSLPEYSLENAANPFLLYRAIPEKVRFQFLLDDSYFFVMSFIKGPVCRGQTSLAVIDDNFWVFFMNPNADILVNNPSFVDSAKEDLNLPLDKKNPLEVFDLWEGNLDSLRKKKQVVYDNQFKGRGLLASDIWNGSNYFGVGQNPNSVLTIFRHFDSASVTQGALGQMPKTFWVMDYLIFEDIFYNLVANYDVFGNTIHQIFTRHHMATSRINSQDLFLSFLPQKLRASTRASWSRDGHSSGEESAPPDWCQKNSFLLWACEMQQNLFTKSASRKMALKYGYGGYQGEVSNSLGASDFVTSLLKQKWAQAVKKQANLSISNSEIDRELGRLAQVKGRFANPLPELSFVRVVDTKTGQHKWYSLIHNREHFNVAFFFETPEQLDLDNDSVDVIPGFVGSYVNAIFDVRSDELHDFVSKILSIKSDLDMTEVHQKYLVSRYENPTDNSRFWQIFDELNSEIKRLDPIEGGIVDLNRYVNK